MAATYDAMIELNGTQRNAALRRLTVEDLLALRDYAAAQPRLPFALTNGVEFDAKRELRRRRVSL